MKQLFQNILLKILKPVIKILPRIKIKLYPIDIKYDVGYIIKRKDIKEIEKLLKEGDIILRHTTGYISNLFTGKISHAGIFVNGKIYNADPIEGKVVDDDISVFCQTDYIEIWRNSSLDENDIIRMQKLIEISFQNYDYFFSLYNDKSYCTEYVANISINSAPMKTDFYIDMFLGRKYYNPNTFIQNNSWYHKVAIFPI